MAQILLVDDEQSVLASVRALLRSQGHEVETAMDGEEAAQKLQQQDFDVLVTDIRMRPIDGVQLMRLARERSPDMGIVVISAMTSEKTIALSSEAGCQAYVKKPFMPSDLLEAVKGVLAQRDG